MVKSIRIPNKDSYIYFMTSLGHKAIVLAKNTHVKSICLAVKSICLEVQLYMYRR